MTYRAPLLSRIFKRQNRDQWNYQCLRCGAEYRGPREVVTSLGEGHTSTHEVPSL